MQSSVKVFKTAVLEDGTTVVLRTDPHKPQILEVIAAFYDASKAQKYADIENGVCVNGSAALPAAGARAETAALPAEEAAAPVEQTAAPVPAEEAAAPVEKEIEKQNGAAAVLTERQSAVLKALRAKADHENLVEIRAAVLAEAASIPLGTIHSALQSLEKKHRILTKRPGSAQTPALFQVL